MSNKSILFEALNTFPSTMTDAVFPLLSLPPDPTTVEDALLASAKCEIEILKFLNTFTSIKIKELYGSVGMLSPSSQAIVGGLLQSDGSILTGGGKVEDIVKILGAESDGGGLTGIYEDIVRRDDTGTGLGLYEAAAALVPAIIPYGSVIAPLISLGETLFAKPGRIGEQVGMILFQEVCSFIREIIINELFDSSAPAQSPDVALKRIANATETAFLSQESGHEGESLIKRVVGLLEEISDQDVILNIDDLIVFLRAKLL
jgi:hypothetical protein